MKTSSRFQPDEPEELAEQVPGGPDERPPLLVLALARPLADEDDLRVRVSLAGDRLRPPLREAAAITDADFVRDGLQRRPSFVRGHATPTARRDAGASQSLRARSSAICTALVAAPLRRLSETTQNASPRRSGSERSWRIRPT